MKKKTIDETFFLSNNDNRQQQIIDNSNCKILRILILWNTEVKQKEIRHPYLNKAITLRKSGNDFEAS